MIADRAADAFFFCPGPPPSYIGKYIAAKAASNTPPTIKIKLLPLLNSHRLDLIISVLVSFLPLAT